jgi:DNA repair exonuclease SbcCD nuclease subunit
MLKFLHAADVHLDSPLIGLGSLDETTATKLRGVTREALKALVDEALAKAVDFVVFAGDLYDGTQRDVRTALFFHQQISRLTREGIPVVVLHGNHDAATELRKLPEHPLIHTFPHKKPKTIRLEHLNVALHGQSFRQPSVTENLVDAYPDPEAGALNIGVLHTALEGSAMHASYAPCTVGQLCSKGYEYWALGHVHEHKVVSDAPWVVFPGNLQGRKVNEPGAKGAVLVTVDDGDWNVERVFLDVLRWNTLNLDVSSADSVDDVAQLARPALEQLLDTLPGDRALAVRVRLEGVARIYDQLWGAEAKIREDLMVVAAQVGDRVYLEKVRNETIVPAVAPASNESEEKLADLHEYFEQAATDPEFHALLKKDFETFLARCPSEVRDEVETVRALREGNVADVLSRVIPVLDSRVREGA